MATSNHPSYVAYDNKLSHAKRVLSTSPEMPEAEILHETCDKHNMQFIHMIGSRVCACPNGCIYSYPALEKKMEV